jgi:L-amino acid N-acyltransferase YncA
MDTIALRHATIADAEVICAIYNQGIEDRIATLETERRTPEERRQWLAGRDARHPVIVAEVQGRVVGWGSLNLFNPRPVYDAVADFSIYVERCWRGHGIGRRLLEQLIALAPGLGYHKMVLAAFPFNKVGLTLYERLGFTTVGVYHEQGQLDGRWVDIIIMEKLLDQGSPADHPSARMP